jgi:hypothetical protein
MVFRHEPPRVASRPIKLFGRKEVIFNYVIYSGRHLVRYWLACVRVRTNILCVLIESWIEC